MNRIKLILLLLCTTGIITARNKHCTEHTFAMIKPAAVKAQKADEIITIIKNAGFIIIAMKKMKLTVVDVQDLYKKHENRRWFDKYVQAMTLSPAIVMILERSDAVAQWDQYKRVIRRIYHTINKKNNIVHGSDSEKDAQREIAIFFKDL